MNTIRWSSRFSNDFSRTYDWIAANNSTAAIRQCALILQAVEQLSRFPNSGRQSMKRGVRELVIAGTPYIVRYRIIDDIVVLIALKHGAQSS